MTRVRRPIPCVDRDCTRFPPPWSAANSRNKILANSRGFDPPSVVVLLPRSALTLTNPSRDVLYEPLTVRPRKSIVTFGATARHVYAVVDDAENERKLFVKGKNNLAWPDTAKAKVASD
jgi:hypothetical protein